MKSAERKARIERLAQEELLRKLPRQTRHAALLRHRVGQVRVRNVSPPLDEVAIRCETQWSKRERISTSSVGCKHIQFG